MIVEDRGRGPAVLLIHGMPTSPREFDALADALEPSRRVLVPALPGYLGSPPIEGRYDMDRVASLLEQELGARGVRECAVVGHSAGGYRALQLALRRVVTVTHLFLLGALAGVEPAEREAQHGLASQLRGGTIDFQPVFVGLMTAPGWAESHPQEAREILSWLDAAPAAVVADELDAIAEAPHLGARVGEVTCPVTARVGALDGRTPPSTSEAIVRAARRGGALQVVPGAGHALLHEDREATIGAILDAVVAS